MPPKSPPPPTPPPPTTTHVFKPLDQAGVENVVREVEAALALMTWVEDKLPAGADVNGLLHMWSGRSPIAPSAEPGQHADAWTASVLEFEAVDERGAAAGVIGYDGSATNLKKGLIVRLPPRSASMAAILAKASVSAS